MIIEGMRFINADNSGAKIIKCLKVVRDKKGKTNLGNFIRVSLKRSVYKKKLKKRGIFNSMPNFVKAKITRKDGTVISGGSNKALLFSDSYKFLGTRCKGLVLKELRRNTLLFKIAPKAVKYHNILV